MPEGPARLPVRPWGLLALRRAERLPGGSVNPLQFANEAVIQPRAAPEVARPPVMAHATARETTGAPALSSRDRRHAITACFLGWTLDAFDFSIVVFLMGDLAATFHVTKAAIVWTLTATLAMRPVGAFLFGLYADRYGRRGALVASVIYYSVIELLCGFAPSFTVFIVLRALYGIGMGGEWGVGASLAMETAPKRWRGILSGVLQSGYSIGYLLAAAAARFILPAWGWRWMFWTGATPALLALYISAKVPESRAWLEHRAPSTGAILRVVARHWKQFFYLVGMMTLLMFLSHGTQDLYPDFLRTAHAVAAKTVADIAMLYNVGAVVGAVFFGHLSEGFGRRRSMIAALGLSLLVIPLWAFGGSVAALTAGAFLMQAGVQGVWGIIPAHLNELSPDAARSLLPGLVYQLGILLAAPINTIEYALRARAGYAWALAGIEIVVILSSALFIAFGREERGKDFVTLGSGG
jgi:SHS family lactate transporter-like MFS transporter